MVQAISVNSVAASGDTLLRMYSAQQDITTISNGSVVLSAESLLLNAVTAGSRSIYLVGSGNALLEARSGELSVQGKVELDNSLSSGQLHLKSAGDINLAAITGVLSVDNNDIYLEAGAGVILQSGASILSRNGDVRIDAGQNIYLSLINAGAGSVALHSATGALIDNQSSPNAVNVIAEGLSIHSDLDIASSANALETTVNTLSVISNSGALYLTDTTSVAVGQVDVAVGQMSTSGVVTQLSVSQQGIRADGDIVLQASNSLTLNSDGKSISSQSGDIYLEAINQSLSLNAAVDAVQGNITLTAKVNVQLSGQGSLVTDSGTLDVRAESGSISMASGALAQTGGGNIRYQAADDI